MRSIANPKVLLNPAETWLSGQGGCLYCKPRSRGIGISWMICWNTLRKNIPGRDDRLVSIIMCVHGAIEVTKACLKSLYRHEAGEEFELIIVDNSSDGQTRQLLQEYAARYATITLIRNEENLGFARGCNIGFAVRGLSFSTTTRNYLLNGSALYCTH